MQSALVATLARLFRCAVAHIVVCRIYAGSTIVEFNVTTNMTQEEAVAAVDTELTDPRSELATTFAAIPGSFDAVSVAVTVEDTTAAPTAASIARQPAQTSLVLVAPLAAAAAVVCIGGALVGIFLIRRARKSNAVDAPNSGNCQASNDKGAAEPETEPEACSTPPGMPQLAAFEWGPTWQDMNAAPLDALSPAENPLDGPTSFAAVDIAEHPCVVPSSDLD